MNTKFTMLAASALAISLTHAATPGITGNMSSPLLFAGGGRAALVAPDGHIAWEKKGCGNIHRVWFHGGFVYWSNADLYRTEITTGETTLVYRPCEKEGLYGFEVLDNGNIVVAENGTEYISELKAGSFEPIVRFKANSKTADGKETSAHHHFRMIRKTAAGTYLVCCSGANIVREYDRNGKLVWEQPTPALAFDCLRRTNGNTLVSHLGAITEYTPGHRIVWQFTLEDAPAELKLNNLCGIQELKNGNLIVGTYANGKPDGSQATAFEVTRDKKIVWSFASTADRSMMTAFQQPGWRWPISWNQVSAADSDKMNELIKATPLEKTAAPRKLLLVTRCYGYSHNDAMGYGDEAIKRIGAIRGVWQTTCTNSIAVLEDANYLAQFDAIALNNCTGIRSKAFPKMREALTKFVASGKGLVLIHSAVDSFYDDDEISKMCGGRFWGHPWHAGGKWLFKNEEPAHPLSISFNNAATFTSSDEIYMQSSPFYDRKHCRVLVSMDLSDKATNAAADNWAKSRGADKLRADRDFAVSWIRPYGTGRVFYTSFGHDKRTFLDPVRLTHIARGVQYALGELKCPDTAR